MGGTLSMVWNTPPPRELDMVAAYDDYFYEDQEPNPGKRSRDEEEDEMEPTELIDSDEEEEEEEEEEEDDGEHPAKTPTNPAALSPEAVAEIVQVSAFAENRIEYEWTI